ncbi:MAG TPA: helix-turn-helix domain-containing protein [Ktedonobacteraceae bacterium]|nr:helix-turn-helix domain-containing protein [Ktedonobacteraceae bacterium]
MQEKLYTPEEIGEMFRVSPDTVMRLLREKKMKGTKFGGQWRVAEKDLEAYVAKQVNIQEEGQQENK